MEGAPFPVLPSSPNPGRFCNRGSWQSPTSRLYIPTCFYCKAPGHHPTHERTNKASSASWIRFEGAQTDLGTTACFCNLDGDVQAKVHPSGAAGAGYNCLGQLSGGNMEWIWDRGWLPIWGFGPIAPSFKQLLWNHLDSKFPLDPSSMHSEGRKGQYCDTDRC